MPLMLEDLVYRLFARSFHEVGYDGSVQVSTESTRVGGRIILNSTDLVSLEVVVDDEIKQMVKLVGGRLELDPARNELRVDLPKKIEIDLND
jgi:hypothetical protein